MITPLKNRVVVELVAVEQETSSGLIKPDTAKEKPQEGVALAIGKNVEDIKVNDKLIFGKFTGFDIEIGGKKYIIINEDDILAIA